MRGRLAVLRAKMHILGEFDKQRSQAYRDIVSLGAKLTGSGSLALEVQLRIKTEAANIDG